MKKGNIITNLILIIALMMVVYVYKPRSILQGIGKVEQITLYNIGSKESIDIVDENEINNYVNRWKQMIVKKEKIVGNSSSKRLVVIFYDENGDTIDTIYISEKNLIHHHWLVRIIDGINPYEELMLKFQEK